MSNYEEIIRDAYRFDGAAITLGSYMENGQPHPGTEVRVPIETLTHHGIIAGATGTGKDELKAVGGIAPATAGVILRNVAELEAQGGALFFDEPACCLTAHPRSS